MHRPARGHAASTRVLARLAFILIGMAVGRGCATGGPAERAPDATPAPAGRGPERAAVQPEPNTDQAEEAVVAVEHFGSTVRARLENGLTVVVEPYHAAPVVAIQVWLEVGSADEGPDEHGLAHLHEHMLFKGTEQRGVGEIAQAIEAAGGDINAWTSFDHTVYHVVLASQFFDLGLSVLADAVQNARFDPRELEREKQVVLEEIKRSRDMPSSWLFERLFATAYKRHPYGQPILGSAESVSGVTRKTIRSFFRRHYRPARMTLVVAGDVDAEVVIERAQTLFAGGSSGGARRPERPAEPQQRKPRVQVLRDDIQETHLGLAWPVPAMDHPDVAAIDVLATLLGQGESSRLTLRLKRGLNLVNEVYANAFIPSDPGLFLVGGACAAGQAEAALEQMARQVAALGAEPVGADELAKVKTMIESDVLYMRETVQGRARRMGSYQVLMDDPRYGERYLSQVLSLEPADLMRVARSYLRPDRVNAVVLLPENQAQRLDRKSALAALRRGAESERAAAEPAAAEVQRIKIRNGPTVLVEEDHSNGLVALRAVFLGGSRYEDEQLAGINNLLAGLLTRGSAHRSADEIAREVDAIAGSLDGFSGRNTLGLRAEFPARFLDRGLELFADCLLHPALAKSEIKRERQLVLEEIAKREDNLAGLAFDRFTAALYSDHPYRLPVLGSRKSTAGLRRAQLRSYYRRYFTPDRMVLAVVGDVDGAQVVERIRALFGHGRRPKDRPKPPRVPLDRPPSEPRITFKHRDRAQAHVVLGFMGTRLVSADRHAIEVLLAALAGQGGRLFVDLRDRRSLAYAITGFSLEGIEPGFLAFYLGTDPGRVDEALAALREQLAAVRRGPLSAAELERAQRHLIGTHAISLQRTSARAAALAFNELYGLGHLAHTRYAEHIQAVTRRDVQRVARKYLEPGAATLSLVGPEQQLPAPAELWQP